MTAMKPAPAHELKLRERSQIGGRPQKDPTSPEWAYQAVAFIKDKWRHIDIDHEQFLAMVWEIARNKSWSVIPTNAPYGSLPALLEAELETPYPEIAERVNLAELGVVDERDSVTWELAKANPALSGEDLAKAQAAGGKKAKPGPGRGNKTLGGRPTKGFTKPRTDRKSKDHLKRRLAAIDAETGSTWIARYQAGEFETVNATARAAGISLRPTITLASPDAAVKSIIRLQGEDYVRDMIVAIRDNTSPEFIAELRRLLDE